MSEFPIIDTLLDSYQLVFSLNRYFKKTARMKPKACALCSHNDIEAFHQDRSRSFFRCPRCELIFVPSSEHVSSNMEKARYDQHNNSPDDTGYRQFLSQILAPLLPKINPGGNGLDYGCGPAPVLTQILHEKGYQAEHFDPIYHNRTGLLSRQYDFVTCTEVVEHFRNPKADWERLINLVRKGGWLAVMTQLIRADMDFGQWYYQRDSTHVSFYSDETLRWIANCNKLSIEQYGKSIALFQR